MQLAGCGSSDGLTRVVVTGTVRYQGVPVELGQIRFTPEVGTAGPVSMKMFRGGKYTCDEEGGVPVGKHRVEILGWNPKIPFATGPGQRQPPQLIPEKYNEKSELMVTLDDESNPTTKDFDLTK